MIMDTERRGWGRRQEGRPHTSRSGWSAAPARVTALRWRDGGSAVARPPGWSSFRNSPLLNVISGCHLAGNAPFPPVAEKPTAQPCDGVAEKVSLHQFAYSVSEGSDHSRPALQADGTRPRKTGVLNHVPRRRFHADRGENRGNRRFGGLRSVFTRVDLEGVSEKRRCERGTVNDSCSRALLPWK